ncbi:MAG: potassium channel protein [Fluviicola sp.]|nr:potassium channel protein [Fluviicola sp.]
MMKYNYKLFSKVYYFLFLLLFVIFGGTFGYMVIENWSFINSFYMTIITISTVGYGEVAELTVYGKLFTSFLIVSSFGTFAYAITAITNYVVGGEYRNYLKEYKIMKELRKMNDHVIICGFGRVGKQAAEDLLTHGIPFVVIERDQEAIDANQNEDIFFLKGDSTNDETLISGCINNAKAIITCLPKDAENVYVVLTAREFKSDMIIVSRASNQSAVSKLRMAGANNVIMPDSIGGSHMASLIANPDVMEFLDMIRVQGDTGCNIETIAYSELPSSLQGKTIEELEAKKITGVTIIGYRTPDATYIVNPPVSTTVVPGSKLFVLGNPDQIKGLIEHFHLQH